MTKRPETGGWAERYTAEIAQRVRQERRRRGWSAQTLSDVLADAGMPMERSVIAGLENGRRATISVAELFAFARVLGMAPLELLIGREFTEVLPGAPMDRGAAVAFVTGAATPAEFADLADAVTAARDRLARAEKAMAAVWNALVPELPAESRAALGGDA